MTQNPNEDSKDWRSQPRGDDDAREWQSELSETFGAAVARLRKSLGLSAVELASRTKELGFPITRSAIARIEGNHRKGKIDLSEVLALAAALEVSPIHLVFGTNPLVDIRPIPKEEMTVRDAAAWFANSPTYDQWKGIHRPRVIQSNRLDQAQESYIDAIVRFEELYMPRKDVGGYYLAAEWLIGEGGKLSWSTSADLRREYERFREMHKDVHTFGGDLPLPPWIDTFDLVPF